MNLINVITTNLALIKIQSKDYLVLSQGRKKYYDSVKVFEQSSLEST
jgi:hypothetical protein